MSCQGSGKVLLCFLRFVVSFVCKILYNSLIIELQNLIHTCTVYEGGLTESCEQTWILVLDLLFAPPFV